jgi:hypothetical protein
MVAPLVQVSALQVRVALTALARGGFVAQAVWRKPEIPIRDSYG